MSTTPIRVPSEVHAQVRNVAALRHQSTAEVMAEAWREYLDNHREAFMKDLAYVAETLRCGTSDDIAAFVNRTNADRAEAAAARARGQETD